MCERVDQALAERGRACKEAVTLCTSVRIVGREILREEQLVERLHRERRREHDMLKEHRRQVCIHVLNGTQRRRCVHSTKVGITEDLV